MFKVGVVKIAPDEQYTNPIIHDKRLVIRRMTGSQSLCFTWAGPSQTVMPREPLPINSVLLLSAKAYATIGCYFRALLSQNPMPLS